MTNSELKLKREMCLEHIAEQNERIEWLEKELSRAQLALKVIDEGLNLLNSVSMVSKPAEYEILFKDFAPFSNIMAHHFPKQKQLRCA